ncbi:glycosyltransferase family 1 protein [Jeotgalibacillus malaysiensis]|uniref:glycosyltransferase family 1 protein n=1 Tax=Jeotgalibacillus malaysiensis TaxID=1508404 RepID=UPI00385058C7
MERNPEAEEGVAVKRILHVTGAMNRGGTETMLMNLYRKLDKTKWQFDFVSYSKSQAVYDEEIQAMGGRIIQVTHPGSLTEHIRAINHNGPYEAVHAHTLFQCGIALAAAKMAGVTNRIAHAHTTMDHADTFVRKTYMHAMRKTILMLSTERLACSRAAAVYLFGKEASFLFLPNAIQWEGFLKNEAERAELRKELGLEQSFVVGHAGRFIPAKNQQFLIKLFPEIKKRNPNAKLLLVGDGDLRAELENQVLQSEDAKDIIFLGLREDMESVFQVFDVFAFPSIYEGLGLVLLEAQAAGKRCIVSEAVQPEADLKLGLLSTVSLSDEKRWIEEVLHSEAAQVSKADIEQAFINERYSVEQALDQLLNIYQRKETRHEKAVNRYV